MTDRLVLVAALFDLVLFVLVACIIVRRLHRPLPPVPRWRSVDDWWRSDEQARVVHRYLRQGISAK